MQSLLDPSSARVFLCDGQTCIELMISCWCTAGQAGLGAKPAAYKGPVSGADHAGHGQKRSTGVHLASFGYHGKPSLLALRFCNGALLAPGVLEVSTIKAGLLSPLSRTNFLNTQRKGDVPSMLERSRCAASILPSHEKGCEVQVQAPPLQPAPAPVPHYPQPSLPVHHQPPPHYQPAPAPQAQHAPPHQQPPLGQPGPSYPQPQLHQAPYHQQPSPNHMPAAAQPVQAAPNGAYAPPYGTVRSCCISQSAQDSVWPHCARCTHAVDVTLIS